ncbi:MAG: NAD(P)/FAD-dependent oxidoreductase [Chloroflexi bacterium]|nr:NAD(P)/FAD-dependent oxidoreductase [Chloroflexota bacterium]
MDIGIVGAGITGLTAAYDLTQRQHKVTLYETRPYPGGVAAGFHDPNWEWSLERFYHHWFATDKDAIDLVDRLGARDRLFFPRPVTSVYHQGNIYPLDSATSVLRFRPLSVLDRLRLGLVVFYLKTVRNWRPLERVTAAEWTRRIAGEQSYEVFWKPMLLSKFGEEHFANVNMAWLWARFHKRTSRLGYFVGGFQAFIDLLVEQIEHDGGMVHLRSEVLGIDAGHGDVTLRLPDGQACHDRVIATCPPHALAQLTPDLPDQYVQSLKSLQSMGAIVLVLALRHPLTPEHYWINIPASEGFPFMGLVQHTNYISAEHYGGDHLVYCGDYLPTDHPYFTATKDQLLEAYQPGLTKINPCFSQDWIRDAWVFAEKYAQPIPFLNHARNIPPLRTPLPGLWMANMSQVYPWDRGTNYSIELGHRVAEEILR